MLRRSLAVLAVLLVITLLPERLTAQAPGASFRAGPAEYAATARLTSSSEAAAPNAALVSPQSRRRQGVVFMLVGAAGIVTGLIVDEPIITIAGAAVAGFGLYLYLDSGGNVGMRVPVP